MRSGPGLCTNARTTFRCREFSETRPAPICCGSTATCVARIYCKLLRVVANLPSRESHPATRLHEYTALRFFFCLLLLCREQVYSVCDRSHPLTHHVDLRRQTLFESTGLQEDLTRPCKVET